MSVGTRGTALASRLWHGLVAYALKFGVVGLVGLIIDVTLFNALRLGLFGDGWAQSPLGAKTISTSAAIIFNWLGNRYWTFREHRRRNYVREFAEYLAVSLGGMAISLGCLWFSHHVLGLTSLLADNVASNVVGLALGTAFRFILYRYWVYGHHRADGLSRFDRVEQAQSALFEEPHASTTAATVRENDHPRSALPADSSQGQRVPGDRAISTSAKD